MLATALNFLSHTGKKAGFLGAAYFIGNLPGTIVLGLISDLSMVGRKPVLLLATFFGAAFTILFGFSLNFGWAMASRMFWGFTEANIGVAKAYISEVLKRPSYVHNNSITNVLSMEK